MVNNRTALVTGATGGVGTAVVEAFAAQGYRLALVAREAERLEKLADMLHTSTLPLVVDATQPEEIQEAVRRAEATFGHLDAVIHLVGGYAGGKSVNDLDIETWERMLRLNLSSAFFVARAALPGMRERGFGRLLFVSSKHGHAPGPNVAAYAASKGGLEIFVRALAAELRGTGVTANAVAPSIIDTPANRRAMPNADYSRWVAPERLASLLLFLSSAQASDINGAIIPIEGGS